MESIDHSPADHRHADHPHDHHHHHDHDDYRQLMSGGHVRKLQWVLLLTTLYMVIEFVGGWLTGSLALTADAAHMFADTTAIALALFAAWFCILPASHQKTFGYQRAEVLAAFFNGILLAAMAISICWESFERFSSPYAVEAGLMLKVAIGGLAVNIAAAALLHADAHHNMNMRGAYLHVLGDLLGSVGAIAASLLILFLGWTWADPLIGIVIAALVGISAAKLLREAVDILLESCPAHLHVDDIRRAMLQFPGITAVHHLHVWNIDSQSTVLTAHLIVEEAAFSGETLNRVQRALKEEFGLSHVTLQMEHN